MRSKKTGTKARRHEGTKGRASGVVMWGLAVVVAAMLDGVVRGETVERRGSAPPLEGRVTSIDDGGVTVRSQLGAVHTVSWDRVRRLRGQ